VDKKEQEIIDALKPHLHPIFHAIGKENGQNLFLEAPQQVPTMAPA
jgi:hypothetical protein